MQTGGSLCNAGWDEMPSGLVNFVRFVFVQFTTQCNLLYSVVYHTVWFTTQCNLLHSVVLFTAQCNLLYIVVFYTV